ncbi:MAG: S8 family peptidase [Eubacteriales bacterium]|nr:S8 family peptidase [Eubacteriales bacterium]
MNDFKLGTEFRLALDTDYETRMKSQELNVGYNAFQNTWELIIRYNGDLERVSEEIGFTYTGLYNGYAIIQINEADIDQLTEAMEIIFIDKPKNIYFERETKVDGFVESCMEFPGSTYGQLTGNGVYVAILDSGIDFLHPDFIKEGGETRIERFWDQEAEGNPPYQYPYGDEFIRGETEQNLLNNDRSGHGTAVASIVSSCVPDADLLIVKLRDSDTMGYTKTTSIMLAIDYVVQVAMESFRPLVINLSYGNNYGDHDGNSILEDYIDSISNMTKISIVVATGNDGNTSRHQTIFAQNDSVYQVNFQVASYESGINLQIWHSYKDDLQITVVTPNGQILGPFSSYQPIAEYRLPDMKIMVIFGYPSPINQNQEIYFSFIPIDTYIQAGIYTIVISTQNIRDGRIDMWLPVAAGTSATVTFLQPDAFTSLTIPASAKSVISVGAYDQRTDTYANFSGRGYTTSGSVKPELVAPGVMIPVASAGGGYQYMSGTSFAAPFVSAGVAMLMEWGIIMGNDTYLYGEKIKAYLIKGARRLYGVYVWPNEKLGYGALCVSNSIPK